MTRGITMPRKPIPRSNLSSNAKLSQAQFHSSAFAPLAAETIKIPILSKEKG
jgi:hypothetical protein